MTQQLTDLGATDPPAHLEELVAGLEPGGSVTRVYDRGRHPTGRQIDAVVVVRDARFADFVPVLDPLMIHTFGAILPGWHDLSAAPADGARSVHLVARGDALLRWRLQVIPEGAGASGPAGHPRPAPTTENHVAEVLVRLHEALERTGEDRMLAAYEQISLALDALAAVTWSMIGTAGAGRGWAELDEALAATVLGRRCLTALRDLTSAGMPAGVRELTGVIADILAVVELTAPEVAQRWAGPLDSYRRYLGIWDRTR
ncbi:hypothetical protein [Paractinoplanes brasiliensis]|uniref:Uncharacterized protein n=1 Tax=Paractinoplanes brasiliensis TaxID=52695 RepID=A0A4R6K451_9ACTN|nr:hypothetical protein [Actinoplanes brasiliensis]TDO42035.1 hypothetical protein C8E87_5798 [Actinoplanes brasiliensis]GID33089.1 hypothetical protein Abr02nite_80720 [Actinoplanes brasiliensis]